MTPTEIETAMTALARDLSAQVSDNYASVRIECGVTPCGNRVEWSCYSPTYSWTSGKTLENAMLNQDLAATLEPATH